MEKFNLNINVNPIAASRPRVSRFSTYYNEPYRSHKELLKNKVLVANVGQSKPLFSRYRPLEMEINYYIKLPKLSSIRTKILHETPHVFKPDLDNLVKATKDALNGLVYYDDAQVFSLTINKYFTSDNPRTEIFIVDKTNEHKESFDINIKRGKK
ncbi:MAG: RusA family crossover junction endodeoxyribonuclease [Poseidonibacter sp.]